MDIGQTLLTCLIISKEAAKTPLMSFDLDLKIFSSRIRIRTFSSRILHRYRYVKRGMKHETNFCLVIYGFQMQVLVVLIYRYIRTIEYR
jgi:hypothetical protein